MSLSDFEKTLFDPGARGSLEGLMPRVPEAWTQDFPDLRSLTGGVTSKKGLRVCIATEDIAGPVRNGGIGTTYAALALLIAELGHETTILYLRGQDVETHTVDHWVEFYAAKGVNFVPAPNYAAQDKLVTNADRWLLAPYNMYRYLQDHPMDVVHTSEWRGSAYLSLLAKRQGLAFADTLFVVKTSSPWMWNRLYGSHSLERLEDLAKITAERQTVELADMVIGGSAHLLRWMSSQGYRLPPQRTFVQPNVVDLSRLADLMEGAQTRRGQRVLIEEIVFFGRLEARKGLFVFCQAIKRLIRLGRPLPAKISFMGKVGSRLPARPDQSVLDYIRAETKAWPTEIEILTEFQQHDAIKYLLSGPRLAVMPSLIENSSLAVYEATICGIPCIASDVGGNAELVHADDEAEILCPPTPRALASKLDEAIVQGGFVARPSFDNDANLETWRWFHRALPGTLRRNLLKPVVAGHAPSEAMDRASVCIYFTGDAQRLASTLDSLKLQTRSPHEILVAVDAETAKAMDIARRATATLLVPSRVIDAFDLDAGAAFDALAAEAGGDALLFLWEGATLSPDGLARLADIGETSGADILTYLYRVATGDGTSELRASILGSATQSFFNADASPTPLFVRRSAFEACGGFETDYRVLNHEHEFVAKARLMGFDCQTAMLDLGAVERLDAHWLSQMGYDAAAAGFRPMRPQLAAAPLSLRDLLLASRHPKAGPAAAGAKAVNSPKTRPAGPWTSMVSSALSE